MQLKTGVLTFALLAFIGSQSVFADQLVTNGGFETGDFSGWTLSGPTTTSGNPANFYGVDTLDAASGNYGAYLSTLAGTKLTLAQTLTVSPSHSYTLSFNLAQSEAATAGFPNSFEVTLNGVVIFNQANIGASYDPTSSNPVFAAYSQAFTTSSAAPTSETLDIILENDNGLFSLDNLSIGTTNTPEPASVLLVIPAALGLAALCRRKSA